MSIDEFSGKYLKNKYPKILAKFSEEEVKEVWESYSAHACAGWLDDRIDDVVRVFAQAPAYFEYKKNNPRPDNDYDNYSGWYYSWI